MPYERTSSRESTLLPSAPQSEAMTQVQVLRGIVANFGSACSMHPDIEGAAFHSRLVERSQPLASPEGWHLLFRTKQRLHFWLKFVMRVVVLNQNQICCRHLCPLHCCRHCPTGQQAVTYKLSHMTLKSALCNILGPHSQAHSSQCSRSDWPVSASATPVVVLVRVHSQAAAAYSREAK